MDKIIVRVVGLALLAVVLVQCVDVEDDERLFDIWPSFVTRKQESNLWTNSQNDELPIDSQYNLQRRVIRGHPPFRHQLRNTVSNGIVKPSTPIASGSISKGPSTVTTAPTIEDEILNDEPTCEELRTIWRLTKRAAMASMANNEVPVNTIGTFGHILHHSDPPSNGFGQVTRQPNNNIKYIHGKKVYHPSEKPFGGKKVDTLRSLTAGSYEQVEKQLRKGLFAEKPFVKTGKKVYASRSRNFLTGEGPIVYGTYSDKGGVTVTSQEEKYKLKKAREQQRIDKLAKTLSNMQSSAPYKSKTNRMDHGHLGFSSDTSGCGNIGGKQACRSSVDCSCYGFYKCVNGQCNSYESISNRENPPLVLGNWHQQVVPVSVKTPPRYSYINSNYPKLTGSSRRETEVDDYLLLNTDRDLEATPNVGYRQQLFLPYYRRKP
ncbi:hypothetical protein CHUAL_004089 [Chamberlinius hualienensis]